MIPIVVKKSSMITGGCICGQLLSAREATPPGWLPDDDFLTQVKQNAGEVFF
jgi:hypothetical protein